MTQEHEAYASERKREIVGVYDRAAKTYDQVGIRTATYFGNLLIESLNLPAGARVLDVATGRGALLFPAAQKVGPTGRVTGIDLAPTMVEITRQAIQANGMSKVEVLLMDADDPDFPEASFDYILCGFALHFLDYPRALQRYRQLLTPGGTIATVGPFVNTGDREDMQRWQWLFQLTREVFPPDFVPPASWTAPHNLSTPERISKALSDAGFEQIVTWREEKVMYFNNEEDWWAWEWSQASRFWLEGMSPEGLEKFKTVSFEKLALIKEPQGIPMRWGAQYGLGKNPHKR